MLVYIDDRSWQICTVIDDRWIKADIDAHKYRCMGVCTLLYALIFAWSAIWECLEAVITQ